MKALIDWLDSRTGVNRITHDALYELIPSGARFRYATGSMLVFAFVTQAITGIFLWMAYSPSSQTAYESVWYIQNEMTGGWLVRGVHHFMAQAMVVVMGLHLLQVIIDGAYKAPREVNYWLGLVLLQLVMGLGLTGYLLPWDQKGYWATNVATNLMTLVPFVGKELQAVAQGGSEYGHHTLTRFFALHAGVLPALLIGFLALHIAVFRRHGITAHITKDRPDEYFWPKQVLFDAIGCLVLLTIVMFCVIHFDFSGALTGTLPHAHRGAELGAPSDPSEQYSAARPEWYFLFLFQLLKYFPGTSEVIGAIVIPGVIFTILALMPLWGSWKLGHAFNVAFILFLLLGAGGLTLVAWNEDNFAKTAKWMNVDQTKYDKEIGNSLDFLAAVEKAGHDAERTNDLILRRFTKPDGTLSEPLLIPKQGAVYLLRNDPKTQGPRLFERNCASCHEYRLPDRKEGTISKVTQPPKASADGKMEVGADGQPAYDELPLNGAPNLYGFASREWLKGLFDKDRYGAVSFSPVPPPKTAKPDSPEANTRAIQSDYFGNTSHRTGRMGEWLKKHAAGIDAKDWEKIIAALSAQARLPEQAKADIDDGDLIRQGITLIENRCTSCHRFGDTGQLGLAPDLTGYGSYEWMMSLVSDPTHARFYRSENDRMPSFAKDLADSASHQLSIREISLIVDWLRGEYYDAHAEKPVLPHPEEEARMVVARGRTLGEPRVGIVGAKESDPETVVARVERLFKENCLACHSHADATGYGFAARRPSAPNLHGIGSRVWLAGLLDPEKIAGPQYFGNASHAAGDMVGFVNDNLTGLDEAKKASLEQLIAALSAEAGLPKQAEQDAAARTDGTIEKGKAAFGDAVFSCTNCHKWGDAGDEGSAPVLTDWGSRDWLKRMIADPTHPTMYGENNDRMPRFAVPSGPGKKPLLSEEEIELLAKWLRGEKLD
jgi:quinol-cytochrome oxidoreductase complex cytochrome b subunit/mono/diheme cytochrome c family protein